MFEFHKDKQRYFDMQRDTSKNYVIPFVSPHIDLSKPKKILEIGCAEAGVLKAFTETGHDCVGVELEANRVALAEKFFTDELANGQIKFIVKDINAIKIDQEIGHRFDLIILKDVIEHIHGQSQFIKGLPSFLNEGGKVFFGFPPWYMPFGGHQQLCKNKFLSKLPFYHLLPGSIYRGILKLGGENQATVDVLQEIKDTGISIERFKRVVREAGFKITKEQLFLVNPIYKFKFNLKPRKQLPIVDKIPYFRNFVSTCAYFLIELDTEK